MTTTSPGTQWTWRWVIGLALAGIIVFSAQRVMTFESRIQVLENEKTYLIDRLDRIEAKIDRMEDKIGKIR